MADTATTAHPTVADPWRPRDAAWLARPPSSFAGRAGRPLLIGGCPRSGTTLLRSMLDNHPDLAIPAETDFVLPLYRTRARFGDLRSAEARRAVGRWIFEEDGHGGRRIRARGRRDAPLSRAEAVERLAAAPPTLGSLLAACFEIYAEAHGKRRWGDKRPAYATHIDAVFALFPDAQFLNVVRDPRGAVASQLRLGWYPQDAAPAMATATWELCVRRVDRAARRLRPDQLLDVRYEDLVRAPERELERVCAFAGLRAGGAIERMVEGERRGRFREGWHDRLAEPVSAAPIDSWREQLTPSQVALVEHVCGAWFERFGYRPLPGLDATPAPEDLRALRADRRRRRRKWRREAFAERRRRLLTRRPVAASTTAQARAPGGSV